MKRFFTCLMLLCLFLTMLPAAVLATETEEATEASGRAPGYCGDDMTWSFDGGVLTISGSGEMDDYSESDAPWLEYKDSIEKLVITGNVTKIGEYAFKDYDHLKKVDFGPAMHTIGKRAFYDCDSLTTFTLPATFRRFGEECFMSCDFLREIRCLGGMPTFQASCLWDCPVSVFYPTTNPWPAEYVTPLYQSYQGKIQIFMGDGIEEAGVQVTEAAETQPPVTEPMETIPAETVPETTAAPTAAETEPVAETTESVVETTEETVPVMTEPEWLRETQAPEEETAQNQRRSSGGPWFGLFLVTGAMTLVLLGALIFRRRN